MWAVLDLVWANGNRDTLELIGRKLGLNGHKMEPICHKLGQNLIERAINSQIRSISSYLRMVLSQFILINS